MKNITSNYNNTLFVDLDGSLVIHNYDPENVKDIIIESIFDFIKEQQEEGAYLILTTARIPKHCTYILSLLKKRGIVFDQHIYNLPAGKRYLINDRKPTTEEKAIAINLIRNKGFGH